MVVDIEEVNGHFTDFLFKTDNFSNCLRSDFLSLIIQISNYISIHILVSNPFMELEKRTIT